MFLSVRFVALFSIAGISPDYLRAAERLGFMLDYSLYGDIFVLFVKVNNILQKCNFQSCLKSQYF